MDEKKTTKKPSKIVEYRQTAILTRVAAGQTIASIARDLKMDERHIYRLLSQSPGIAVLQDSLQDAYSILQNRLPNLVSKSLDAIESTLDRADGDRRRDAAKIVLSVFTKLTANNCPHCNSKIINP